MEVIKLLIVISLLQLCCGVQSAPPKPSPGVLAWTKREIGAFFSFNMITEQLVNGNENLCLHGDATKPLPSPSDFNPSLIDLDNWLDVAVSYGAKYAVLTAQHCSGFSMWPTNVQQATGFEYQYSVKNSPLKNGSFDVVKEFVDSCKRHNVTPGIYYGLNENFYLNVASGKVMNTTLSPGQQNVTQDLYNKIILAQMRELWSNYGELSELWFDGGCIPGLEDAIGDLASELQPNAVYFGGCSKTNNLRWVGTESGEPNYPIWSTATASGRACQYGSGDKDGTVFCPAETDTTLQLFDTWFYLKGIGYRDLNTLKTIYLKSVGQNTNLLLNTAANSSGLIPEMAQNIYKQFGDWIQSCFGTPVTKTSGSGYNLTLNLPKPTMITKISVGEDQTDGEMVTSFTITAQTSGKGKQPVVSDGQSIGNKFIADIQPPMMVSSITLTILSAHDTPVISDFSVHECKD
ncbi:uncharacterized protein [Dysidea avara]|uniref:uncharacterized protein n=1 Tax=Dysidea avara TaxID=196820 RepID=UPI00332DA81F